jgi:hypothetical protein
VYLMLAIPSKSLSQREKGEVVSPSSKFCKYSLLFSLIYICAWPIFFKVVFILHELVSIR